MPEKRIAGAFVPEFAFYERLGRPEGALGGSYAELFAVEKWEVAAAEGFLAPYGYYLIEWEEHLSGEVGWNTLQTWRGPSPRSGNESCFVQVEVWTDGSTLEAPPPDLTASGEVLRVLAMCGYS